MKKQTDITIVVLLIIGIALYFYFKNKHKTAPHEDKKETPGVDAVKQVAEQVYAGNNALAEQKLAAVTTPVVYTTNFRLRNPAFPQPPVVNTPQSSTPPSSTPPSSTPPSSTPPSSTPPSSTPPSSTPPSSTQRGTSPSR